jgi:ferredoxin--NADP+ reductase
MLSLTAEELSPTDTTDAAVMAIVESGLREVVMLGRRGPAQAAFTNPELKELGELAGADVIVERGDLELDPASEAALAEARGTARRNVDLLREYAAREPEGKAKQLVLRFLVSPVEIRGEGKVEEVEVVHNMLAEDGRGGLRAVATDRRETIPCGLVLRSVGYRGVALPGVPFDENGGVIPNADGRVVGADGEPITGVYCAGWIKRGPSGVIGTNKKDAAETAANVLEDAEAGVLAPGAGDLAELLEARGLAYVDYEGWQAIDRHEQSLGAPHGRPRTKLATWGELLHHGRRG